MTNKLRLFTVVTLSSAFPVLAHAASPPATKYCTALSKAYDRYIGGSHGAERLAIATYGEAACRQDHANKSIPVLEKALVDGKVPLPPRPSSVADSSRSGEAGPKNNRSGGG